MAFSSEVETGSRHENASNNNPELLMRDTHHERFA
jgi:hypothetical protein